MKNINIFKNICLLSGFILFSASSAFADNETVMQTKASNILNTTPGKSMIMTHIEEKTPSCKSLIWQSNCGIDTINSSLDDLKSFAIKETKDSEKIEKAIKNTNSETAPIGPSALNPQKTITLDDLDDFDDSENSFIKIKILTKEKPENTSL